MKDYDDLPTFNPLLLYSSKNASISLSTIKTVFLFILILSGLSASSQSGTDYNWKGTELPLYEKPATSSRILINIPKGGAVHNSGSFVLPDYALPKKEDHEDFEKITAAYMAGFFGPAISKQKKELKKQEKGEINYEKTYRYRNGDYYKTTVNYLDGGIGGETHTLFLKGLKKHEALMLLLKLTSLNDVMPEGIKNRWSLKVYMINLAGGIIRTRTKKKKYCPGILLFTGRSHQYINDQKNDRRYNDYILVWSVLNH